MSSIAHVFPSFGMDPKGISSSALAAGAPRGTTAAANSCLRAGMAKLGLRARPSSTAASRARGRQRGRGMAIVGRGTLSPKLSGKRIQVRWDGLGKSIGMVGDFGCV